MPVGQNMQEAHEVIRATPRARKEGLPEEFCNSTTIALAHTIGKCWCNAVLLKVREF